MKRSISIYLFSLLLTCANVFSREINYAKSVVIDQERKFPLSEEEFYKVAQDLYLIDAKHVNLLIKGIVKSDGRISFGDGVDGGDERGYLSFARYLHQHGKTITFKLVLMVGDNYFDSIYLDFDNKKLKNSLSRFVAHYTKMAKMASADEVALTGFSGLSCQNSRYMKRMLLGMKEIYPAIKIRMDWPGPKDFEFNENCLSEVEDLIDHQGVDLPDNPSFEEVQHYLMKGFIISRLTFKGDSEEQDIAAEKVFSRLEKESKVSFGIFSPIPPNPFSSNNLVRGKSTMERINQWFKQN